MDDQRFSLALRAATHSRSKTRRRMRRPRQRRLLLEPLEDRRLLTVLSIDNPSQLERSGIGSNDLIFTVTRSGDTTDPATVRFSTLDGTATEGSDYLAHAGQLTFSPGVTEQPIRVTIKRDDLGEFDEHFFVDLADAAGAALANARGRGTIIDDDDMELTDFASLAPLGGLVYEKHEQASLAADETASFLVPLDAGQTIALLLVPTPGLIQHAELFSPGGESVAEAAATTAGEQLVLGPVTATTSGNYRFAINGVAGTEGDSAIRLLLNAAFETETYSDTANDSFASAQDITDSFISVGTLGTQRGAAVGLADRSADSVGPDLSGYYATATTFEFEDIQSTGTALLADADDRSILLDSDMLSGFSFDFYGETYTDLYVSSNGLLSFGAPESSFANSSLDTFPAVAVIAPLWDDLDSRSSGGATYWEVRGTADQQQLIVQWDQVDYFDSRDADPITFQMVLSEVDGSIQFNYLDLAGGNAARTGGVSATVGIKAAGDQIGQRLLVSHDGQKSTLVESGRSISIRRVTEAELAVPDFYRFPLTAGKAATFVLTAVDEGMPALDLYDTQQRHVATGLSEQADNQVIRGFVPSSTGDYYARITGSGREYSLVVIDDGDLSPASNDAATTAQTLPHITTALGHLSSPAPADVVPSVASVVAAQGLSFTNSTSLAAAEHLPPYKDGKAIAAESSTIHRATTPTRSYSTAEDDLSTHTAADSAPHISALLNGEYATDRVIVRFADTVSHEQLSELLARFEGQLVRELPLINGATVELAESGVDLEALAAWNSDPLIAYVEPDYVVHAGATPNDPSFSQLWGLHNTGQSGGTVDADIDAVEAWETLIGSESVVVASVDGGVDYTHVDLRNNMWVNPGEIAGDGIDNDANGFVDDVHGIDTANDDSDPFDDNGHGTHTAGTIGAVGNNERGVTGVNWNVQIMALKFLSADGSGFVSDAIDALNYMTMMKRDYGVNVVASNNSWSGSGPSLALREAIEASNDAGIMFIASAGNTANDNDASPSYPSGFELEGVIAVAATDHNDQLASFSSFGATSVDLGAPGVGILSTRPGDRYGISNGTSMAAPHVAGAVAMLMAHNPGASLSEVKRAILDGTDPASSLADHTLTGGRLNLANSLALIADPGDFYRIALSAGDPLRLTTSTPSALPSAAGLDPAVELYSLSGELLGFDDNSHPDGRNAELRFSVPTTEDYLVRVFSMAGRGEYGLTISGETERPPRDLAITDVQPRNGQPLVSAPTNVTFGLDGTVLATSVDAADLLVDGVPAVSARLIDGNTLSFAIPNLTAGRHVLQVAAGALRSVGGAPVEEFSSDFVIDQTPPHVVSSSVLTGDLRPTGDLTYVVHFDEPLRAENLDRSDVELSGELSGRHEATALTYDPVNHTATIDFAALPDDRFSLVLKSRDGAFEDLAGNDLDGDGTDLPSGDSAVGGDFSVAFWVDEAIAVTRPFARLAPFGGTLFSSRQNQGVIHSATDIDEHRFFLESGQVISATVTPTNEAAQVTVELRKAGGLLLHPPVVAASAGAPAHLPPLAVDDDGPYHIRITADRSTAYELSIDLNLVREDREFGESPVVLDRSLSVDRYAAVGTSEPQPLAAESIVWGAQPQTGMIISLDPRTGNELYRFPAPGGMAAADTQIGLSIAENGRSLLYVNSDVDPTKIYRLDPLTGSVISVEQLDSAAGDQIDGLGFQSARHGVSTIYSADMETDPGWVLEGGWSYGTPTGAGSENHDPSSGFTGGNVIGYNLSGNYPNSLAISEHATTPAIDASNYDYVTLSFRRWLGVEEARSDRAAIEVSRNGSEWVQIWENPRLTDVGDIAWDRQTFDLSSVADGEPTIFIRWAMGPTNGTNAFPGWNVDDVLVTGVRREQPAIAIGRRAGTVFVQHGFGGNSTLLPQVVASGALGGDDAGRQFAVGPGVGIQEYSLDSPPAVVQTVPTPSPDLEGLAFDGQYLYASTASGTLFTLDPDTGAVRYQITVSGGALFGLGASRARGGATTLFQEDFSSLSHGFTFDNSFGVGAGLWHVTGGRNQDGLPNHSAPKSLYFGKAEKNFGGGNYDLGSAVAGLAISPVIVLPDAAPLTLSFSTLIATERGADHLEVLVDDGATRTAVLSTVTDTLTFSTGGTWRRITADLTRYAGKEVRIVFSFMANSSSNAFEGWYVDDIEVTQGIDEFDFRVPDVDEYVVDLTGRAGHTMDFILEGHDSVDFSSTVLELLGIDGSTVLATAAGKPAGSPQGNHDLGILDFAVPEDGVYTIRTTSLVAGEYSIVVFDGQFDSEPNDDLSTARLLNGATRAVGYLGQGAGDNRLFLVAYASSLLPGTIYELDSISGTVTNSFPTPNLPGTTPFGINLAFDAESLWYNSGATSGDNLLYRLNPDTGAVVDVRIPFGNERFDGLARVGDELFTIGDLIQVYDARQPNYPILRTFPAPSRRIVGLAGHDSRGTLFVLTQASGAGSIYEINPQTGAVGRRVTLESKAFEQGLAIVGEELFVSETGGASGPNIISVYDVETLSLQRQINVLVPTGAVLAGLGSDGFAFDGPDSYALELTAGQMLAAVIELPFASLPGNELQAALMLWDPQGMLVAEAAAATDGTKTRLVLTVPTSGTFTLQVVAEAGGGDYVLETEIIDTTWVAGRKFHDLDESGERESTEPYLNGWTIELLDSNGQVVASQKTRDIDWNQDGVIDESTERGWYRFGVEPGSYSVREVVLPGWRRTAPISLAEQAAFDLDRTLDFYTDGNFYHNWGGRGERWLRAAGDGGRWYFITQDGTVQRWDTQSGVALGSPLTGTVVASLAPVYHADPARLIDAPPPTGTHSLTLSSGQQINDRDFGNYQLATLQGRTFDDQNANGVRDAGESFLAGWLVELLDATGQIIASQETSDLDLDGDGKIDPMTERGWYSFVGLAAGTYSVRQVPRDGWLQTSLIQPAIRQAFDLDQQYDFFTEGSYWENWGGEEEKWLQAAGDQWFYVKPNGELRQWDQRSGTTFGTPLAGTLIATVDTAFHEDPGRLIDVIPFTVTLAAGQQLVDLDIGNARIVAGSPRVPSSK